jgi:hypothetical protein
MADLVHTERKLAIKILKAHLLLDARPGQARPPRPHQVGLRALFFSHPRARERSVMSNLKSLLSKIHQKLIICVRSDCVLVHEYA